MKKKEVFSYIGFCLTLLLLTVTGICEGWDDGMEIIVSDLAIDNTLRHQWYPDLAYNPVLNEYMVTYRTTGPLRDDCDQDDDYECTNNYQSIGGRRVSAEGKLLGDSFQWSSPEVMVKGGAKIARNIFTNEYMLATSLEIGGRRDMYIGRLDSVGTLLYGLERLHEASGQAGHEEIVFNTVRQEYLVLYNDDDVWNNFGYKNNVGFILDKSGIPIKGPFPVGNQVGTQYAQWAEYNPDDNSYLVAWEDFRHAKDPDAWFMGPDDTYGALLDSDGIMIKEIAIMEDCELPGMRMQMTPAISYNPDKKEFLVAWTNSGPDYVRGCIMARIVAPDGTLKGEPVLVIDGPEDQITPAIYYIEEKKKYFMVFSDNRDWIREPGVIFFPYDIYGMWLDDTGAPITEPVAFAIKEGKQSMPKAIYNPLMDQFLVAWRDMYAPDDYPDIPDPDAGNPLYVDHESDIRGVIYGTPSFLTVRIVEQGTGDPVEDALALVIGPAFPALLETNAEGWFNISRDSQPTGIYVVILLKLGYHLALEFVEYAGEPLKATIEMAKW